MSRQQVLKNFCQVLEGPTEVANAGLNILRSYLEEAKVGGELKEELAFDLEDSGCLDTLESFQRHPDQEVYEKSLYLLHEFFEPEEVKEQPPILAPSLYQLLMENAAAKKEQWTQCRANYGYAPEQEIRVHECDDPYNEYLRNLALELASLESLQSIQ